MFLDGVTYYNFLELAHQTKIKRHQIMIPKLWSKSSNCLLNIAKLGYACSVLFAMGFLQIAV